MAKTKEQVQFVKGDSHLERLLAKPGMRAAVDEIREGTREMDRVYADSLAAIRKAGELTQAQVAERLGVGQAAVSRMEARGDVLLSTLNDYLEAAGATDPRIVVVLNGVEVELALDSLRQQADERASAPQ